MAKKRLPLLRKDRQEKKSKSVTVVTNGVTKIKNNPNENPRRAGRSGKRKRMVQ
jgi:hypothetical protein